MKIHKTIRISAPIDRVWQELGPNYERAGDWASAVFLSRARPEKPTIEDAPVSGRVCQTSLGPFTESIVAYDPKAHHLAYSATGERMPGFVRSLVNSWTLTSAGEAATEVAMEMRADLAPPFNILMGWMMKRQFNRTLTDALEEFKHFVETGKPHPRKLKIDGSKKAIAARRAATA